MQLLSYLIAVGTLISTSLAVATCPTPATCNGVSGIVATAIKSYAPAQTLCSSKYPVPRKTCTSVAPTAVVTSTVATSTSATTVATTTITAQAAPFTTTFTDTTTPIVTSTETDTVTETTTTTFTSSVTVRVNQQPAALTPRAVDPRSSQLSSLIKSQASSFVGAVCTCIETPASTTVTTTPISVTRVIATLVQTVTASSTTTVTPTSSTTTTVTAEPTTTIVTETTTTTSTVTTTVTDTTTVTGLSQCSYYGSEFNQQNECTDGCLCDSIAAGNEGGKAYCYRPPFSIGQGSCLISSDCPPDTFCDTDNGLCQDAQGCASTFTPAARFKRAVAGRQVDRRVAVEVNPAKLRTGSVAGR